MKKLAITFGKYAISLSILGWLFWQASGDDSFEALRTQPKDWGLLILALLLCLTAVIATFVRWYLLVRALKLPFTLMEGLRLGFVGFLFNFLTLGVVGGDLVKAIFLARRQPGRRTEAVATVVIDRMIGLYALFLVASVGIFCTNLSDIQVRNPDELAAIRVICWITVGAAIAGTVAIVLIALPSFGTSPLWEALCRVPKVGPIVERVTTAVKIYRGKPALMLLVGVMSLGVHVLLVCSVYMIARGLPGQIPSFGMHFIIVPLAMVANTVPLPGGLGAFEVALDFLYRGLSNKDVAANQGFVIALAYRVVTIVVAVIGAVFYLANRREMSELVREAKAEEAAT